MTATPHKLQVNKHTTISVSSVVEPQSTYFFQPTHSYTPTEYIPTVAFPFSPIIFAKADLPP
jgi:hypothetical protein